MYGAALSSVLAADVLSRNPVLASEAQRPRHALSPRSPHYQPTAKSVILLFMDGGPSQVDLIDHKPAVKRYAGQLPDYIRQDIINDIFDEGGLTPSPWEFARHGQNGLWVSELLPNIAEVVDDLCVIHSMQSTQFNHDTATFLYMSGHAFPGYATAGSWVSYGLGTLNQNLPAFVVLGDPESDPQNGIHSWGSGTLPPVYQGTQLRVKGQPILNLRPPGDVPARVLDAERELLAQLSAKHRQRRPGYPDLDARISSYELAARMQVSATDALDVSQESEATKDLYGVNDEATKYYGRQCLMARRLVERGVRFVQVHCGIAERGWDHHAGIEKRLPEMCAQTDRPAAALIKDLKQRGMLDETLVIWSGEFGRMPMLQKGATMGRDHGPLGFTSWLAGGGVKRGYIHGATDELGFKAVVDPVTIHDFHATVLHLLGLDNERLVFRRHGLDDKLTNVQPARIVEGIVA